MGWKDAPLTKNTSSESWKDAPISGTEQPLGTTPQPELWGGGSQFSSGVLQGLGDELKAGVAAAKESFSGGLPFGEAYDQALPQYQRSRELYKKENPILAPTLDIAGQTAPWLAGARFMPTTLPGAPMLQKMQQNAHLGAKLGALSGFTNAEGNLVDRVEGAGIGLGGGAVIGAASPPVVEGLIATIKFGINQLVSRLPYQQQSQAARKIAEAMERDGVSPEQAAARMEEMGSEAALLDLGPNTRALAGSAQQTPGEGKTKITDFLINRQEGVRDADKVIQGGQVNRISGQIEKLVPEKFRGSMDDLTQKRGVDASPLYDEAFAPISNLPGKVFSQWDDRLQQFLDDPIVKSGMNKGIRVQQLEALAEGKPFNFQEYAVKGFDDAGELIIGGTPNLRAMDAAKRGIDTILEGYRDKTTGRLVLDDMGRAINKVRKSLVSKLDDITTDASGRSAYKDARAAYAGPSKLRDATVLGQDILGNKYKNIDEVVSRIKGMSDDELHYMRIGAAQSLRDKIGTTVTRGDATKKILDIPELEKKIRAAFGDDEMFKKYITGLETEKEMFKGYSMMGGSQTAEREAAKADAVIDPSRVIRGLIRMKSPNPIDTVGGMVDILGGSKDRLLMSEKLSKGLGEGLTGQNAASIQKAYRAGKITNRVKNDMIKALTITGATGGQETMQKALGAR